MDNTDVTNPAEEVATSDTPKPEVTDETLTADDVEETTEEGSEAPEEEEELDIDGNPLRVPKTIAEKLKARMMMQADYTQKTQTLAEQRRALEAQRQATEWEAKTRSELFEEEAQLFTVAQRLDQFQGVNWQALAQQDVQQYAALQAEYTQLRDYAERLHGTVEGRKTELAAKRQHEEDSLLSQAVQILNTPDPENGWDGKFDAERSKAMTDYLVKKGANPAALSQIKDPLSIKIINKAMAYDALLEKQHASLKTKTPEAKPVPQVATGKTRTGPVNPDRLSAEEWVRWREREIAKKRGSR